VSQGFVILRWSHPCRSSNRPVRRGPPSSVSAVNLNPSPLPDFTRWTTVSGLSVLIKMRLASLCGLQLSGQLYSNGEVPALLALAVSDPSFRPNAIPEKSNQHASLSLPAPHRGDAYTLRTHVLSGRHFLKPRFVCAR